MDPRKRSGAINLNGVKRPDLELELPAASDPLHFDCELISQTAGKHVILRCSCYVAEMPLNDPQVLDALYELQKELLYPRICARPVDRTLVDDISIEGDLLFRPKTTQIEELESLIMRVTTAAHVIHERMEPMIAVAP